MSDLGHPFQPSDEGRGAAWCNKCGHRGHKALECLSGETGNVCPCPYHSAPAATYSDAPPTDTKVAALRVLEAIARRFIGRESSVGYDHWLAGLREAFVLGQATPRDSNPIPCGYCVDKPFDHDGPCESDVSLWCDHGRLICQECKDKPTEPAKGGEGAKVNEHAARCDGCGDPVAPYKLYYCEPCVTPDENDMRVSTLRAEIERLERERALDKDAVHEAALRAEAATDERDRLAAELAACEDKLAQAEYANEGLRDSKGMQDYYKRELKAAEAKLAEVTKDRDESYVREYDLNEALTAALAREAGLRSALETFVTAPVAVVGRQGMEYKTESGMVIGLARWILDEDLQRARAALKASPAGIAEAIAKWPHLGELRRGELAIIENPRPETGAADAHTAYRCARLGGRCAWDHAAKNEREKTR